MRSWIGRVVFGLGGFLVVAGLLGLVWAPGVVEKTPVDVKTSTYLDGEAGKLDASTGELVRNPIFAISDTRTDSDVSTDDVVAWVSTSCVMIDRGGERECVDGSADMITASVDVFATDRVTGEAVNEGVDLPADATPHEGLVNKWPFNAEQTTYPYWDGTLGRTVDAVYDRTEEYVAANGHTRLVDLTTHPSDLHAPLDKIHPMPFPGLNIDNLPFFAVIAAVATGQTLLHDWVYENRAIYLTELTKLGAQVKLLDPHRVMIEGPTHFSGTEIVCPPALRPAVVILLAMLASKGTSVLRSTYVIARGYEDLAERLNELGAQIEPFRDI